MPTVFVSHSSEDAPFIEKELLPFLADKGITTWYSPDAVRTADEWQEKIRDGLRSCDWFLVVLSRHATRSDWVRTEVHWAMKNREGRVIPLLYESCEPEDLHLKLPRINFIDFRNDRGAAKKRLLEVWTQPAPGGSSASRETSRRFGKLQGSAILSMAALAAILVYSLAQRRPAVGPAQNGASRSGNAAMVSAGAHPERGGDLRIQMRDELRHKISFSIVSTGSGQFVVERLFLKLHGTADCPLRNEVSVTAAASIPTSYAVHLSKQYSEYDLPVLLSPGEAGVWKYTENSSDEFSLRLSYDFYTLFLVTINAEVRSLRDARAFQISSGRLPLLDVARGNAGGCRQLDDWYTPDQLVAPGNAQYLAGFSTLARQLLTADLDRSVRYLHGISSRELVNVLPELTQAARARPDNVVFARNRQVVTAYLRGSPWDLQIRSAQAVRELIDTNRSQPDHRVVLRPPRPGQTFLIVHFALSNLSSTPSFYDLRDFRLLDSHGREQKSLGILLALSPPTLSPGTFFDEPFRVDPGEAAVEPSETTLVFAVDEKENRLALKYGDLEPVDLVVER